MEKMERIEYLIQCWELGTTLCQGLAYLAQHPRDESVRRDVRSGAEALQSALQSVNISLEDSLWNILPDGEAKETGRRLNAALSGALSDPLLKELNAIEKLRPETAQALFRFYDAAPHASQTICQLLFNLCEMTAASAPQESFFYTLKLLEEYPNLLSGENMPHPGYVYRPSEQRTFDRCPICGGMGTPYYRAFAYRMADFGYPNLPAKLWMKCENCGDLYTWKYPEEFLARAKDAAWLEPRAENEWTATASTSGGSLAIWGDILNRMRLYTGGKNLLEVGIGRGELLAVALEMGYAADGVEISLQAAQKVADMLQIPIWRGDFLDYAPDKTYDIITMGDVLEHVAVPEKALQNACRLLKEDGVLWLSTPNFQSSFSRMLKFSDPMWCEPHHISYFSRDGLKALAERCGLVLREYHVSRRYNGSMEVIFTKAVGE